MQGLILLVTFLVMALISIAMAITVGLVLDRIPNVHDLLSVMGFFGTLVILLPICWLLAVRFTEPKRAAQG